MVGEEGIFLAAYTEHSDFKFFFSIYVLGIIATCKMGV